MMDVSRYAMERDVLCGEPGEWRLWVLNARVHSSVDARSQAHGTESEARWRRTTWASSEARMLHALRSRRLVAEVGSVAGGGLGVSYSHRRTPRELTFDLALGRGRTLAFVWPVVSGKAPLCCLLPRECLLWRESGTSAHRLAQLGTRIRDRLGWLCRGAVHLSRRRDGCSAARRLDVS